MNITPLSQRDDRWKLKRLGEGTGTIGSYGCTLTSITVAINAFGAGLGVDDANEKLKAVKGFGGTTNNLVIWAKLPEAFPQIKSVNFPQPYDNTLAKQMLDKGYPVVVKVNGASIGAPDGHWCLLIGDKKMVDPWTGQIVPTSTYPILKLVAWELQKTETMADYYKGLDLTNKESMKVAVDAWYSLTQGEYVKAEIVTQKDQMIENLNGELRSCNALRNQGISALEHAEEENKILSLEKERLQGELVIKEQDLIQTQKMYNEKADEVGRLQERVTELEKQIAGGVESDKPIPYKKLYQEALVEVEKYQTLIETGYIKKAGKPIFRLLQEFALEMDQLKIGKDGS